MSDEPIELSMLVQDDRHSMRCMLAACVQQAVHLALIDSVSPPEGCGDEFGCWTDEEKARMQADIFAIPEGALEGMDPMALAQNVACRLLGYGGWSVGGVYSGNGSARDVFDATFTRPDHRHIDDVAFDLGLKPEDEDEGKS